MEKNINSSLVTLEKQELWNHLYKFKNELIISKEPTAYDGKSQIWSYCSKPAIFKDFNYINETEDGEKIFDAEMQLLTDKGIETLDSIYNNNNWVLLLDELLKGEYIGKEVYRKEPVMLTDGLGDYTHVKSERFPYMNRKYYLLYELEKHLILCCKDSNRKLLFSFLDSRYKDGLWQFGDAETNIYNSPVQLINDYKIALYANNKPLTDEQIRCKQLLKRPAKYVA